MKKVLCYSGIALLLFGCGKSSPTPTPPAVWNGTLTAYSPAAVPKTSSKKVFVHYMPWFETPATLAACCQWGIHWTMSMGSGAPQTILPNGQRKIASHYYPMIGPYASSDTAVIDYQLLLMKLSGIDGLIIDWPGRGTNLGESPDLIKNAANTNVLISRLGKVGLKYAICYEDQYVDRYADIPAAAKSDINYARDNYFNDPNYETVAGKPLLMVFGPQAVVTGAGWTTVFSELPTTPSFYTLWYERNQASGVAAGEYSWVVQNNTTSLNNFYSSSYNPGAKISSAYPGFKSYYALGGWPGPTWTIEANGTATFNQTLDLALAHTASQYLQLVTWNDYGEGTMIEPTNTASGGFGYSMLTMLQQKLGISILAQADLEIVAKFYEKRVSNAANPEVLKKLNQVYYYLVSLQMQKAKELLDTI